MKYIYTTDDLDLISWDRIDKYVNKIYEDVLEFISDNNLKIRYISTIVRGGDVPGIMLSHKLNVIDMLPIQIKHNHETNNLDLKINLDYVKDNQINNNECILLVEGNHVTGKTANKAISIIKDKFGENVKIIYVSITRDYSYKDSVNGVIFTTWGMSTNEMKELSQEECEKLNISYNLVSVYPWENIEEELAALNAD